MSATENLTEEERRDLELAEQARQNSGDWDSVKPGKAANFGQSFGRLIGLLKPHALAFVAKTLWFYTLTRPSVARLRLSATAMGAGLRGDFTGHERFLR